MKALTEKDNLFVLVALFMISLAWSLLRSSAGESIGGNIEDWLRHPTIFLIIACIIPAAIWIIRSETRATYFFGASSALGMLPPIPHLPFLQQFSHLALIIATIAAYRAGFPNTRKIISNRILAFYFVFLAIAMISVALNFILFQSIWQIKVGISNLIIPTIFGLYLASFLSDTTSNTERCSTLLKGFLDSAFLLSVIGIAATVLLFVTPFSTGNGVGNDTIHGLGYFDRMQLMFTGPVAAGMFFVLAILFTMKDSQNTFFRYPLRLAFLQIAPWLVMASGSRVAKIALIIVLIVSVSLKSSRKLTLLIFPSALLALSISMYYQSLPFAVHDSINAVLPQTIVGNDVYSSQSLRGRFFSDDERSQLLRTSIEFFQNAPLINQIFGSGFGVAGFRTSEFPSPHNQLLNILIDCGIVGTLALLLFIYQSTVGVLRIALDKECGRSEFSFILLTALTCLFLFSMVYTILPQGITLLLFSLIFAWVTTTRHHE